MSKTNEQFSIEIIFRKVRELQVEQKEQDAKIAKLEEALKYVTRLVPDLQDKLAEDFDIETRN